MLQGFREGRALAFPFVTVNIFAQCSGLFSMCLMTGGFKAVVLLCFVGYCSLQIFEFDFSIDSISVASDDRSSPPPPLCCSLI